MLKKKKKKFLSGVTLHVAKQTIFDLSPFRHFFCFFCMVSPGGRHGESDQDQCERPVGGRVQRQARPLPFHPRATAGTKSPG